MTDILQLLSEDRNLIPYRKELNKITGGVTATLLLTQILYWHKKNNGKFYKFIEPCKHDKYKTGDSFTEELGFSKKEFSNAIKKIGFKLGNKTRTLISDKLFNETGIIPTKEAVEDAYNKAKSEAFIVYYIDSNRLTWYDINADLLNKSINAIYLVSDERSFTKVSDERSFTNNNIYITETTTDIKKDTNVSKESGQSSLTLLASNIKSAINKLFSRRDTTQWSDKELQSLKKIAKRKEIKQELQWIEWYYNTDCKYLRRDIATLLNNWTGELDRAIAYHKENKPQKKGGWDKKTTGAIG